LPVEVAVVAVDAVVLLKMVAANTIRAMSEVAVVAAGALPPLLILLVVQEV
jgi:hypothetical protein